jgi:hypothetical protein
MPKHEGGLSRECGCSESTSERPFTISGLRSGEHTCRGLTLFRERSIFLFSLTMPYTRETEL